MARDRYLGSNLGHDIAEISEAEAQRIIAEWVTIGRIDRQPSDA